jgi:ABC-type nitrate/sulfonate/bicarbonate transport system substrate-binding protein
MKRPTVFALIFILVAIAILISIKRPVTLMNSSTTKASKVKVQLQWFDGPQFLGFYVAAKQGLYAKEGLEVELIPGGFTTNAIQQVADGNVNIGLGTGDQVLIQYAQPANVGKFVAVGTVFRQSVAGFLSRKTSRISGPKDLVGKSVGVYRGFDTENLLLAMLKREGIDTGTVNITDAGNLQAYLSGSIDAFPAYSFNEPVVVEMQNEVASSFFSGEEYGIRSYSDTLIVNREWYRANGENLKKFLKATQMGWKMAKENPDKSVDLMYEYLHEIDRTLKPSLSKQNVDTNYKKALRVVELVGYGPNDVPLVMEPQRWQEMEIWLQSIGKIQRSGLYSQLCDFNAVENQVLGK